MEQSKEIINEKKTSTLYAIFYYKKYNIESESKTIANFDYGEPMDLSTKLNKICILFKNLNKNDSQWISATEKAFKNFKEKKFSIYLATNDQNIDIFFKEQLKKILKEYGECEDNKKFQCEKTTVSIDENENIENLEDLLKTYQYSLFFKSIEDAQEGAEEIVIEKSNCVDEWIESLKKQEIQVPQYKKCYSTSIMYFTGNNIYDIITHKIPNNVIKNNNNNPEIIELSEDSDFEKL